MFKTLINAWNVKDIRTKMLYTLLLVVIYRFGSFIPVPGVDASKIAAAADTYSILSFLNLLSGGNFGQFTIFAMGITPYITGSIIIQLLTIAIPSLEKMAKEEDGREKLATPVSVSLWCRASVSYPVCRIRRRSLPTPASFPMLPSASSARQAPPSWYGWAKG
mgnify:CR=1 FL=1